MTPALATTAIFTFIWTWNDFFSQLIYLTDPDKYTVPVALRSLLDRERHVVGPDVRDVGGVAGADLLVFLFGQRYLIRGIATTGIK